MNEILVGVIVFMAVIIVFLLGLVAWLVKKNTELGGTTAQLIPQELVVKTVQTLFQQFAPILQTWVAGTKTPLDNAGYNWLEAMIKTMVAQELEAQQAQQASEGETSAPARL